MDMIKAQKHQNNNVKIGITLNVTISIITLKHLKRSILKQMQVNGSFPSCLNGLYLILIKCLRTFSKPNSPTHNICEELIRGYL